MNTPDDEDKLRERIMEISPEIRHDVNLMADMIRQIVRLERDKAGLDENAGRVDLVPYPKKSPSDPDFSGIGTFAGQRIEAAAWIGKNSIRISLLQKPVRPN